MSFSRAICNFIKNRIAYILILFFVCMTYMCVFAVDTYAAGTVYVSVKTVIDNVEETDVSGKRFYYSVSRVYSMQRYPYKDTPLIPRGKLTKAFSWTHGKTQQIYFEDVSGNVDLVMFESTTSTDAHLSLSYIEYIKNAKSYTYTDGGRAKLNVTAFNWADISSANGSVELVLHFRYNPDIGEVEEEEFPEPSYTKQIDYLGDGVQNPDTSVSATNAYRLYLNVKTKESETVADRDIVFLLDISGSMKEELGTSTRFEEMRKTVKNAIKSLVQNPDNKITIITFESTVQTLISNSSDINTLYSAIDALSIPKNGGTNYYKGLKMAGEEVEKTIGDRESVVFFLTDGLPTAALDVINAIGYTLQAPVATIYAAYSAKSFPSVDHFYSVYVGSDTGAVSTLQTVTQMIPATKEKFTVQATSAEQLTNTFERFISKIGNSLYDVSIEDTLSTYVDYAHDTKVEMVLDGVTKELAEGKDYTISYDRTNKKVTMTLAQNTVSGADYIFSFNIRVNDEALNSYDIDGNYPHIGDANTDYTGNVTSAGQAGYYSNTIAKLLYSHSGGVHASHTYPKPVVQVVMPEVPPKVDFPTNLKIAGSKILTGKVLEDGEFSFNLEDASGTVVSSALNDINGDILFDSIMITKSGEYIYQVKEVIPKEPKLGFTYDDTVYTVRVKAVWQDAQLVISEVTYVDGTPVFNNRYEPQPVVVNLEAQKVFQDSPWGLRDGEFNFGLYKMNGSSAALVSVTENQADGKILFDALTFDSVGVYEYRMQEILPENKDSHIIYDLLPVRVVIRITDQAAVLQADVTYGREAIFTNVFEYEDIRADICATKVLNGMELVNGMFTFELLDTQGHVVSTASNDLSGQVYFTDMTFDEIGSYNYVIREVIPKEDSAYFTNKYMTFDTKEIGVHIEVTDTDGDGVLESDVTYTQEPKFYNKYKIRGNIQ